MKTTYEFTVILAADDLSDDDCERLCEAGCDDGTIVTQCGVHFIGFHRESDSLGAAIRSAIADMQKAGLRVAKVELEPEALAKPWVVVHFALEKPGFFRKAGLLLRECVPLPNRDIAVSPI